MWKLSWKGAERRFVSRPAESAGVNGGGFYWFVETGQDEAGGFCREFFPSWRILPDFARRCEKTVEFFAKRFEGS
jgi:hypothetical protein